MGSRDVPLQTRKELMALKDVPRLKLDSCGRVVPDFSDPRQDRKRLDWLDSACSRFTRYVLPIWEADGFKCDIREAIDKAMREVS